MAIKVPGRRLMATVKLAFVRRKVAGVGHRPVRASLSLTSMIDFLVVTVVFLLMTFSASGETPAAGTQPGARNVLDGLDAPIVSLAGSQILLDGRVAGNTRTIEQTMKLAKVDELATALAAKRAHWRELFPGKAHPGVVILQIDEKVPAVVVKSAFQTAALAGFPNVSFMVNPLPR